MLRPGTFVARDDELSFIDERLQGARGGRGGLVLLAGEPGIGKTRLASEVAARARARGMTAVWGRCREDGGAPAYWPWVQALRSLIGEAGEPVSEDVADLIAPVPDPTLTTEPSSRFRLFESVSSVVRRVAGDHGALIVLDDLNRADEGSLLLLRYLAPELADARLLVLGAFRDTEVPDDHPLAAIAAGAGDRRLRLGGLSVGEVAVVIASYCDDSVAADVASTVAARTGGNPLFVIEVARLLRSQGGDAAATASHALPATVRGVIHERIVGLPVETRRALSAAAVLGRDFGRLPLAEMLGASELAAVAALQPAAGVQLIVADPLESGRYRFTHALVQEALYEGLPVEDRTVLHRRAADAIESHGADADEQLSDLAFHSYHASLGVDPRPARRHTLAAGRRARQRLAYEEAARWLSLALELSERADLPEDDCLDLLLEAAEADARAGHAFVARGRFERAAGWARRRGDGARLARAALGVGTTVVTAGVVDWPLVALLEEAADAAGDDATRATLASRVAIELYWHEGGVPARRRSAEALALADASGEADALGVALHARQFTLRGPGHLEERIAIGEQLVESAERRRDRDLEFQSTTWLAADVLRAGNVTGFRSRVQALHDIAARSGQPLHRWYATLYDASQAIVEGRIDEAVSLGDAAAALGRRLDVAVAPVYHLGQRAVIARERGGLAGLVAEIADAEARFPYFVTIKAIAVLADADAGNADRACADLDRLAPDGFAAIPPDSLWLATVALLAEAAAVSGSVQVGALAELLRPHQGELVVQGLPNCWGSADRFLGRCELALGHLEEAEDALVTAEIMEQGMPLFLARTRLEGARLAAARGQSDRAAALAAEVRAAAQRMGLTALAASASGLARPAAAGGLSRREREVLTLLSKGATNKEIAAELVLSLNTVERHLANVYTKLGVRGRAEASAFAVRAGLS